MRSGASTHTYEIRPRHDLRGFDLIPDALPFGRLWFSRQLHTIKNRIVGSDRDAALSLFVTESI
jgi:hypothetical protein